MMTLLCGSSKSRLKSDFQMQQQQKSDETHLGGLYADMLPYCAHVDTSNDEAA